MGGRFEVIVSTDAGNEGIDLQAAHVLVNWDIPWSLVRLEQRMGRIHRIGQQQKVHLYNLVALGTREGDAHWRLLERLVDAANELGGKMFDSLAAIMELARSDAGSHERLMHLFYGPGTVAESDFGIPTVEEIKRARDDYYDELRSLSSKVDVDAANTARHQDRIARVNPVIVERFLDRAHKASLIVQNQGGDQRRGLLLHLRTARRSPVRHPRSARRQDGKALVATRADLRQNAIDDGVDRAADAAMLGPSDPAFTALVEAVRGCVSPEMWQGAVLFDRTVREDYTLFVYECDITEGAGSGHRRPRPTARSWLILVDRSGQAHSVSWEILPNLTPAANTMPIPLTEAEAEAARQRADEEADTESARRAGLLAGWRDKLSSQLGGLPRALTKDIDDPELRRQERRRIQQQIEARIQEAATAAEVVPRRDPQNRMGTRARRPRPAQPRGRRRRAGRQRSSVDAPRDRNARKRRVDSARRAYRGPRLRHPRGPRRRPAMRRGQRPRRESVERRDLTHRRRAHPGRPAGRPVLAVRRGQLHRRAGQALREVEESR